MLHFLSNPKLLPGESESEFHSSLQGLLSELNSPSPLNVALVIQLNECLWWIKRHAVDKELLLHESMARILARADSYIETYDNHQVSSALENYFAGNVNKGDKEMIDNLLKKGELTMLDLRARGFKDASKHLKMADELIHRQYQTMRHLQKSIDAVDFKSRIIKRMDLELTDLENKAQAIDVKPS
ncbi:hypothetical protein BHECKSOX_1379 [Bathymodiolus heckerae thiotrophic gill symbiont]|uniref:hypothetical protein n=1 Tax=Bathymodiolus heckerae thiotrophic gill symbiont TaxID=1052212 RepID=UPI0010B9E3CD|nr:hypothetical protein [Bathymodiolus heckerae thiotrophic gill symbiont]SHN91087.1 hypothetical protein BHECKSOX_1379 [Bathymodiolus heckerae thiotrophic gill symbiont]